MTTLRLVTATVTTLAATLLGVSALILSTGPRADPNPPGASPTTNAPTDVADRPDATTKLRPDIVVVGADAAQQAAVNEALNRFVENGLELPDLEIRFLDDEAGCQGHYGLFSTGFTPWRISICSDVDFVITHELAHAWERATLDDHDREMYLAARGLSTWKDRGVPWNERGAEDAAFIIQQNLMTISIPQTSPRWQDRMAAYELLTGRASPVTRG